MSFGPLGAVPLAATLPVWADANDALEFNFGVQARLKLRVLRSSNITFRFFVRAEATVSQHSLVFTALPANYEFSAVKVDYDFVALPVDFIFRGMK